jgi:hypothetical protein
MAAVTGTGSLAISGVLTLGAPSGGVYAVGMSFTNAAITQPQAPAVKITSQLTGSPGLAGTYQTNLNQVIASSTFTLILWATTSDADGGMIPYTGGVPTPPVPSTLALLPPPPLPLTLVGSTAVTSYSG